MKYIEVWGNWHWGRTPSPVCHWAGSSLVAVPNHPLWEHHTGPPWVCGMCVCGGREGGGGWMVDMEVEMGGNHNTHVLALHIITHTFSSLYTYAWYKHICIHTHYYANIHTHVYMYIRSRSHSHVCSDLWSTTPVLPWRVPGETPHWGSPRSIDLHLLLSTLNVVPNKLSRPVQTYTSVHS